MSYVDASRLKVALDNILSKKNYRQLPHKKNTLLDYLIERGELLAVGDNGGFTFGGEGLYTVIGRLLSRQDLRDDFGIIAPGSKNARSLGIPDGAAFTSTHHRH
jgi:hypothetical protein